jgi:hypothetical protein
MKNKLNIITKNKEIYEKLNMLNITPEVIVKNISDSQMNRIIGTINKTKNNIKVEKINDYYIIKRISDVFINAYFR